jgi:hypothetical protein
MGGSLLKRDAQAGGRCDSGVDVGVGEQRGKSGPATAQSSFDGALGNTGLASDISNWEVRDVVQHDRVTLDVGEVSQCAHQGDV